MSNLSSVLQDYRIDFLNMDIYEVSQLSETEFQNLLRKVYENRFSNLPVEEIASEINNLSDEFSEALDQVEDYAELLAGQIEELEESGQISQARSDQRILDTLNQFLTTNNLSDLTTEMTSFMSHLSNIIVETEEDEYFSYDSDSANRIYGGEIVKFKLTASAFEETINSADNPGDKNNDGIADTDINEDGIIDAVDMQTDTGFYDMSAQDLFLEINEGDQVISTVWNESSQTLLFEIETATRTIINESGQEEVLSPKSFMIEIEIKDLSASNIFFKGKDYYASPQVFENLPTKIQKILFDNDAIEPMAKSLSPEEYQLNLNEQLKALPGYQDVSAKINSSLEIMEDAFKASQNSFSLPTNADEVLQEMIDAAFNNKLLNSYSDISYDEAADSFHEILESYSASEKSALMMSFVYNFIATDGSKFADMFSSEIGKIQNIINCYEDENQNGLSFIEKAIHTLIQTNCGLGKYQGMSSTIFTSGVAFGTHKGTAGLWTDHEDNVKALKFLQENGFDTDGSLQDVMQIENGLIAGEISAGEGSSIVAALSETLSHTSDTKYWKGANLSKKEWDRAIRNIKNNLVNLEGELHTDPLQVIQDCMKKFFKDSNAADNFASAFLFACDNNLAMQPLMTGPHGKNIAKFLWQHVDNGSDKPPYFEEAKDYKNKILAAS